MAEVNIFHYIPRQSLIHNLDSRVKLIGMILFSITITFVAHFTPYLILTAVLALLFKISKLPVLWLMKELKYFWLLILMVIIFQAWSIPGTPVSFIPVRGITYEGLRSGLFFGWRMILIITSCVIFTGTTLLSSLRDAVVWFLKPIPFIPAARIGTMISLTFVLIPLIFDQAAEISDAQKARCVEERKNPVKRISLMVYPLLSRTFIQAEEIIMAMEARCYSEHIPQNYRFK